MKRYHPPLTASFALICCLNNAHAMDFIDPMDGTFDMGEYLAENAYGFLPVPILVTEPAVGYGFGMAGVFLHESEQQKNERQRLASESLDGGAQLLTPAVTVVGGFATENGTWMALAGHMRSWGSDTIRYKGGIGYGNFKLNFYPFEGNQLLEQIGGGNGIEMTTVGGGVAQSLQHRIGDSDFFVGLSQRYFKTDMSISSHPGADKLFQSLTNTSPNISALGFTLEWDSRNNFFNPTSGYNYTAEYLFHRDGIGSDYEYDTFDLEGLNYWALDEQWNLAIRGQYKSLRTNENYLPPQAYPDIELRGVSRMRYQGEETLSFEGQVAYKWTSRWSTNVFGGLGYTGHENDKLLEQAPQYSYGVGFRYLIARRYGLNAGVDLGFSEDESALYFQVGTGF